MKSLRMALLTILLIPLASAVYCENVSSPAPEETARKALDAVMGLQQNGGWGRAYSLHGDVMWGEHNPVPHSWITVQPPATPTVATVFLRAGQVLEEPAYIEAARKARNGLAALQTAEGGFPHEGDPTQPVPGRAGTFDDNVTPAALDFLIAWWHFTGSEEDAALVRRVGDFILAAQYEDSGGWPQRYPGGGGYGRYITFNDSAMVLAMRALMKLDKETGDPRYRKALEKGTACILRLQGGPGEEIWAQQYDTETLEPAWARKFEPPGYTPAESGGVCRLLLDLYLEKGNPACLEAIEKALAWYEAHRLPNGKWARLYEPGTARPVYGRRDKAEKVYDFEKACEGYGWQGNWYPEDVAAAVARIHGEGREKVQAERQARQEKGARSKPDSEAVRKCCESLSAEGFWLRNPTSTEIPFLLEKKIPETERIIHMADFVRNTGVLLDALTRQAAAIQQ